MQHNTSLWVQQCKVRFQLDQGLFFTLSCKKREIEPLVLKKANQFVSLNVGNIRLHNILDFCGKATNLDAFLKAYKAIETKSCFPYE